MSSEQESLAGGDDGLIVQPDSSNTPISSDIKESSQIEAKEIGQEDDGPPKDKSEDVNEDVEVILDSADDDEDLHLKWEDDDEEIEEDIISLDIPPSPSKDEQKDKIDTPLAEKDVNKSEDEKITPVDNSEASNEEKIQETAPITEPFSPEETIENMQLEIDNICAGIKENIDEIDNFDDEVLSEKVISESTKPTSPIDDLILIEDDDKVEEKENIEIKNIESAVENEIKAIDEDIANIVTDNISGDDLKESDKEKTDNPKETDLAIDVSDIEEVDLADEVSVASKDIKSIVIDDDEDETDAVVEKAQADENLKENEMEVDVSNIECDKSKIDNAKDGATNVIATSSPNQSLLDTSSIDANTQHGLNKPDMMLEIPTQEVIEFLDDTDISDKTNKSNETSEAIDIEDVTDTDTPLETNKNGTGNENNKLQTDSTKIEEKIEITKSVAIVKDSEGNKPEVTETVNVTKVTKTIDDLEVTETVDTFEVTKTVDVQELSETIDVSDVTKMMNVIEEAKSMDVIEMAKTMDITEVTKNVDVPNVTKSMDVLEVAKPIDDIETTKAMDVSEVTQTIDVAEMTKTVEATETTTVVPKNMDVTEMPKTVEVIETTTVVTKTMDGTEMPKTVEVTETVVTKTIDVMEQPEPMDVSELSKTMNLSEVAETMDSEDIIKIVEEEINSFEPNSESLIPAMLDEKQITETHSIKGKEISNTSENITPQEPKVKSSTTDLEVPKSTETIAVSKLKSSNSTETKTASKLESSNVIDEVQTSTSKQLTVSSANEPKPSTSNSVDQSGTKIEDQPSTSSTVDQSGNIVETQPSTSSSVDQSQNIIEAKPSTSSAIDQLEKTTTQETPDSKDELQEVTDSLGLLAESSRVMEDDEEQEQDDQEDEDEDDDFDQDESSNQMTAEHSEDSNAQHSETDAPKEQEEKQTETESPKEEKTEFGFSINDVVTLSPGKEDAQDKDGDIDVDDIEDEVEVTPEQIGDVTTAEETVDAPTAEDEVAKEKAQDKPTEEKPAVDVETVKLSDTSDNEEVENSLLKTLLEKKAQLPMTEKTKSPAKKLEIAKTIKTSYNFVDLEESSSEDDVQEVKKNDTTITPIETPSLDLLDQPKTPTKLRTPRINTSEISIRTISSAEAAAKPPIIPPEEKSAPKFGLEVFSLDSDEEDSTKAVDEPTPEPQEEIEIETPKKKETHRCINLTCKSVGGTYVKADAAAVAYYDAAGKKRTMVCEQCNDIVVRRTHNLVTGIKEFTPLLDLDIVKESTELVEISDSESEDDTDTAEEVEEKIGEKGAKLIEEQLAELINQTWKKYKMDARLNQAEEMLNGELKMLEEESKEIDSLLNECQIATDKLRNDLYATFEHDREELSALVIYDTPTNKYSYVETDNVADTPSGAKRRMSSGSETPAKRPHNDPIPLGYAPIEATKETPKDSNIQDKSQISDSSKLDDDKDISVLQVSAEVAPSELPPPGEVSRPPLRVGTYVYGMRNVFGSWVRCRIIEVQGKSAVPQSTHLFTICKVKFEGKVRNPVKSLPARCLAYSEPTDVRLTIGTRVIALFKDTNDNKKDFFYSGIISEVPNPVNKYRYLVFFDDGYAQYVRHADTRLVCECASLVWEEVHPFSREFVREYLMAYPERPMVRLHAGQSLKTEWNGKWWSSRVIKVDASLVQVHFEEDNRTEWIYRGSTRLAPLYLELQAAERHRARPMPRTKAPRINMPYVEYTRSDEQNKSTEETSPQQQSVERETRQRAVAKKSTTPMPAPPPQQPPTQPPDSVTSRVVYYTPKNAVRPYKMVTHTCGPQCKRTDVLALKDLRTYNPLAKPLLSGWERQIVRFKGHKEVMYRAPCGRRVRNMRELHRYLRAIQSDMAVDLFDFAPGTHCLAEFVLNSCLVGKKDLSHGKENVPVPCVNYYDESLPEFCSYNTERTPTAGVPLNLDPEFLCGCDCTDDCEDKSKCACWQMTLEGARTIGLDGPGVGYVYRRLPEPLPTGIYECNSRCKCKQTCLNRVAQHPLQLKLQVFKTLNRGWGIRALNDVPKGSFLCVYAGNLLTDATANMDGLNEGDEYLAELDYIEVVEQMKEGFEEDIPEADKRLDKKNQVTASDEDSEEMSSSEEEDTTRTDQEDDDFRPAVGVPLGISEFNKRLRKRDKKKQKEDAKAKAREAQKDQQAKGDDDCITISDDEEVREPSRFMAQAGMESNEFKSKYRSVRSYFGKDEACYIMDAKVQGNIGRYLNHSCTPNVFVQNVFVDTHDPRFPWVAFFALCHIKAGTELTWNYNYDVGSVPGKVLYCYCGAPNCRGRLL